MPDSRENTVSVRIYSATKDAIEDEQTRLKREGGKKLSLADLVERAWAGFVNAGKPMAESPSLTAGLSAQDTKTLETLAEMMRDYPAAGESIARVIALLSKSLRQKN